MQLGRFHFDTPLILSPMAGVTDKPFRRLCRRLGADMAVSEMVRATHVAGERRGDTQGEPRPRSVQIIGNDPAQMAEAARINVASGADIIDINMGCPAKKYAKKPAGSALMAEPDRVAKILRAVVRAVEEPVTLKIRTGVDENRVNALEIGRIAEAEGVAAVAVHGRTRAQKFTGLADHGVTGKLVAALGIPVFANGDIDSPAVAQKVLAQTGAAGVLVGRAARRDPWIFARIRHFLAHGTPLPEPSPAQLHRVLRDYLEDIYAYHGQQQGVSNAAKQLGWCVSGRPGSQAFRRAMLQSRERAEQAQLLESFCSQLDERRPASIRV